MSAACSLALYLVVYAVTVVLFVDDAPGRIPAIAGWTAVALVVRALTSAASEHLAHTATYRMLRRLRLRIVQTLQSIPLGRVQARSAVTAGATAMAVCAAILGLQWIWSTLWLRFVGQGPIERLWRMATWWDAGAGTTAAPAGRRQRH